MYDTQRIIKYSNKWISHESLVDDIERFIECNDKVKEMRSIINSYGLTSMISVYERSDELINELDSAIKPLYENFTQSFDNRNSRMIADGVFKRLTNNEYCFQGGIGHQIISTTHRFPSHWCIKPERYNAIKPTDYEKIALKINSYDIRVFATAEREHWGN